MKTKKLFFPSLLVLGSLLVTTACGSTRKATRLTTSNIQGPIDSTENLDNYLKSNNFMITLSFDDSTYSNYYYKDNVTETFSFILIDPNNFNRQLTNPFMTAGTWSLTTIYKADSTIFKTTSFEVVKQQENIPVTSIVISPSSKTLAINEKTTLSATVLPINATNKSYTWSSVDPAVARVTTEGEVTALKEGTTAIKATANDGSGVVGLCAISVTSTTYDYSYTFTDEYFDDSSKSWSCITSGSSFVNGIAINSGKEIWGRTKNEITGVKKVIVRYHSSSTSSGKGWIKVGVGDYEFDKVTVSPVGSSTHRLEFTLDDIDSGLINLRAYANTNSLYIEGVDIVLGEVIYPTSITLASTKTTLKIGETAQLTVNYSPSNTNVKRVIEYNSSSSVYVSVNSQGVITGQGVGNATISVKVAAETGYLDASIAIKVDPIPVQGITLSPKTLSLNVNESSKLTATFNPTNATNKGLTWTSKNTAVATVDNSGNVKAVAVGTATIEVKTTDGGFTDTCSVTVTKQEEISKTTIQETYTDLNKKSYYETDDCPNNGNPKLLIIPIWFTNSSTFIKNDTYKANVKSDIEKAYLGTSADVGWRSVKTYYEELSSNKVSLRGTVADWYSVNMSSTNCDGDDTVDIVKEASDYYFSTHPSDSRRNYDTDGNGYLDGVILIYGAPDYQKYGNNDNLWAYCYWCQESSWNSTSNPGPNVFFWASYDFMYGSNKASSRAGSSYYNGDTSHCSIDTHTFIHEMGHVFGLDDYYDYSDYGYKPAGGFSMQDYNVGSHDPFSVMALGWANPYIPTNTTTIQIKPFQSSKDIILLTPSWNSRNSAFDEYLLLELYTPTGLNEMDCTYRYDSSYPQGPSSTGIRLWHVDARLAYVNYSSWAGPIVGLTKSNVEMGMSNTYNDGTSATEPYLSPLGSTYYDFNLLQLIRNDTSDTYKPNYVIGNGDLFTNGSSFNMTTFASQFKKSGKLNSGTSLGWSFSVSISGSGDSAVATVTCTKA